LGYACLWYYQQNKNVEGIQDMLTIAMESILEENNKALVELATNFPLPGIGPMMSLLCFPTGKTVYEGPTDKMRIKASQLITNPSGIRDLLSQGVFVSDNPKDRLRMLVDIFPHAVAADKAVAAAKKAKRELTQEEKDLVNKVKAAANDLVQVDSFDKLGIEKYMPDDYVRPALRGTRFVETKTATAVSQSSSASAKK